jgi:HK97 family phage portal protein
MGLFSRLRAASAAFVQKDGGGGGAAALPAQGFLPTLGATPSSAGLLISQGTSMAVSSLYACVTIRAQDVARCTPQLWRRDAAGKRIQVTDHPLCNVFRQPNEVQTWFEFMEQMQGAYLLRGNGYAAIKRDNRGKVFGLIPINPDAVLVLESWDGQIFYNVNRIGLWQIAMLREFPPSMAFEDIFHMRGISFNALVAASTIGFARDAIGVAMGLEQQVARMIQNGARPSVVLQTKGTLTEAIAVRLKRQWEEFTSGIQNVGKTAILEGGLEAKALQLSSVDMEMIAQRNFQLGDVSRFYHVPAHKLGLEQLRGVNIVQMDQDYVSNTIMPDLHRWEQKFDRTFKLAEQDIEIKFDETVLLRADIATRYNAARVSLLSGWTTVNEIRAGENLDPVEGGNQVYRPLNMAGLGSDVTGTAPDGAGAPPAAEGGAPGADNVPTSAPSAPSVSEATQSDAANANHPQDEEPAPRSAMAGEDALDFLKKTLGGELEPICEPFGETEDA